MCNNPIVKDGSKNFPETAQDCNSSIDFRVRFVSLFLETGLIIPVVQSSGTIPEKSTKLKTDTYNFNSPSGDEFRNSFIIPSVPHALLLFADFMAYLTSSNDITLLISFGFQSGK